MKIHQEKCHVDKRKLVLAFSHDSYERVNDEYSNVPHEYLFSIDGWGPGDTEVVYTKDGKGWQEQDKERLESGYLNAPSIKPTILTFYKHCLQAALEVGDADSFLFIDRRYEHNHSYDVYFQGQHYLVGKES